MVVVSQKKGCCWCIPISTYGGRGTLKPGLRPETHAIIYMDGTEPTPLKNENGMTKEPLKVERTGGSSGGLDHASRVNFDKVYTVEHDVKVMNVGKVCRQSMPKLEMYWRDSHY